MPRVASDRHALGTLVTRRKDLFSCCCPPDHGAGGLCSLEKCLFHTWHFVPSEPTEGARPSVPGVSVSLGLRLGQSYGRTLQWPPSCPPEVPTALGKCRPQHMSAVSLRSSLVVSCAMTDTAHATPRSGLGHREVPRSDGTVRPSQACSASTSEGIPRERPGDQCSAITGLTLNKTILPDSTLASL